MDGAGFWALAVLAAALVGLSKGGLPVVGMLGVPVLSLAVSPVVAAGLLLPMFVASDAFGLYAYRRSFDARVVALVMMGGTVGVAVGWATASIVSEQAVTVLVGIIGLVFPSGREAPRTPAAVQGELEARCQALVPVLEPIRDRLPATPQELARAAHVVNSGFEAPIADIGFEPHPSGAPLS
jgi:uncharacterized membrane protein YfcA